MEGNLSQGGDIIPGQASYCSFNLPGQMQHHHQFEHMHTVERLQTHPCQGEGSRHQMTTLQSDDKTNSMADFFTIGDTSKLTSARKKDESNFTGDIVGDHNEMKKGEKELPWQRVKWTADMVRLLITAVSYVGDQDQDATSDCWGGIRRKFAVLLRKGKWKSISKVMAERGYHVSPQQCEHKINDLSKKYYKLNDMLGRGTSCDVVKNPAILDVIDFLSKKEKNEVRKILRSKHLYYEEMCSYINGNRLYLSHDLALQRSVQLALKIKDDHGINDDGQDGETDDHDDFEENYAPNGDNRGKYAILSLKKLKQGHGQEDVSLRNTSSSQFDMNEVFRRNMEAAQLQKQWSEIRSLQLENQELQIQVKMLKLEKKRQEWRRFDEKQERELKKLRMENEKVRLENEHMAFKLKQMEMDMGFN